MIKEKLSKFYETMESNPGVMYNVQVNGLFLIHKMDENGNVWIDDTCINKFHWECGKAEALEEGYPDMDCEYEVVN